MGQFEHMPVGCPTFFLNYGDDGQVQSVDVDALPPLMRIDERVLRHQMIEPFFQLVDKDTLRIEVSNAACTYRRIENEPHRFSSLWIAAGG